MCHITHYDSFLAPALKDMASAAQAPGSSPDEYKAHIEKYFASKLIPGAPSDRYAYSQNRHTQPPILHHQHHFLTKSLQRSRGATCWLLMI